MSTRKRNMLMVGGIVLILVLFIGINVVLTTRHAATFAKYWQDEANEPVPANAIRLVALGDSAVEAIGATDPMEGFVGRIATYVQAKTGRAVHIINVASGTNMAGMLQDQLPRVDLRSADIVVVANSNDLEGRVPLDTYRANLRALLQALPPDKTIFSDLPLLPGRDAYQAILQQEVDSRRIQRADFAKIFNGEGRRLDIFSWLFPHLNSTGYYYWFLAFKTQVDQVLDSHQLSMTERSLR